MHRTSSTSSTATLATFHPSSALPVLIAGAGLGGLALANSLSRAHIPFVVLERDADLHGRAQGYRISIDGGSGNGGADGLRAVLSEEKFAFFEKTCGNEDGASGRVDAKSGKLDAKGIWGMLSAGGFPLIWALLSRVLGKKWDGGLGLWSFVSGFLSASTASALLKLPTSKKESYQIDRRVVRSILFGHNIAPHVRYGSAVQSYTVHADSVEAHLSNGESVHGSLLVGADGIRSNIASQLLASAKIPRERTDTIDLNVRVLYGKAPLTPELLAHMNKGLHKGMAFVIDSMSLPPNQRVMVVVKAMRFNQNVTEEEKAAVGAENVQVPEDYVFFAMAARTEVWHDALSSMQDKADASGEDIDARLLRLNGEAARDLSLSVAAQRAWDPSVRALLEGQDASQTAVLRTTSSNPAGPPVWDTNSRVTVLGDAVHCMPPTGGQGGNTALWDGAVLGKALEEEWRSKGMDIDTGKSVDAPAKLGQGWTWSPQTIRRYEDSMRANAGDIVALACIGATYLFGGEDVWR